MTSRVLYPLLGAFALATVARPADGFAAEVPAAREPVEHTIRVVGRGKMLAEPDVLRIELGVETEAKTVGPALEQNNRKMERVITALKENGVAEQDIQTRSLVVRLEQPPGKGGERPEGPPTVHVTNMITATLREIDHVGDVLGAAVEAGANQSYGLTFEVSDVKPLEATARKAAVVDARKRAEELASAAGVSLGPVLSIRETSREGGRPMPATASREMAESIPIETGQIAATVDVEIVYSLGEPPAPADETSRHHR